MSSGPPPVPVFVAAVLVLVAGIAAVIAHDGSTRSEVAPTVSTAPLSSTTATTASSTASTTRTTPAPLATTPTTSFIGTSVRPNVTSPEAAANGLWAAYAASNRQAARRFATDDVVQVLFQEPYDGEQGMFQGCRPHAERFECEYTQPSAHYGMTVQADDAGSFKVVELTVSPST